MKPAPAGSPTPPVYGRGSAILADEKLIVLGEGRLLGLFKASPQQAKELSRTSKSRTSLPCWAAPVLSRKKVYLRSEDRLVCFDLAQR